MILLIQIQTLILIKVWNGIFIPPWDLTCRNLHILLIYVPDSK